MKTININFFSMVEIALAVAILAVGATTVVTLVPVGIKQNTDSLGQNYSSLFANDAHAYLSNLAKTNWSGANGITSLPSYGGSFGLFGDDNKLKQEYVITSTTGLLPIPDSDLFASSKTGVYAVAKSTGTTGQDFSAQIIIWQSGNTATPTPLVPFNVNINNGTVTLTQPANFSIVCVGSEFCSGTTHFAVELTEKVINPDGTTTTTNKPFGTGVASAGENWKLDNSPTGTAFSSSAWDEFYERTFKSDNTTQFKILVDGDKVPNYNPAEAAQKPLGALIAPYADPLTGKIKLLPNQVIYCVDMNEASGEGVKSLDYQDLVYVATVTPTSTYTTKSEDVGISPTNNDYAFDLLTEDGTHFNRDSMQANKQNDAFNGEGQIFETNSLKLKTKNSDATSININGQDVPLNGKGVTLNAAENGSFKVQVWKDNSGMGQWHIKILEGSKTTITADDGTTLNLPRLTAKQNRVGINTEISWPLSQPNYDLRNKLRYYFEVYNMENIGM